VLLLGIGVWCHFESRSRMIALGRDHQLFCSRRALTLLGRLPDPRAPLASSTTTGKALRQTIDGDPRYCGMAVRMMGFAMPALITTLVSACFLIWLEPGLSLLIGALGILVFALQYPANLQGANASATWEGSRVAALRRLLRLAGEVEKDARPLRAADRRLALAFEEAGPIRQSNRAFWERLTAIEHGTLALRLGSTLILALTLVIIATELIAIQSGFARLLAFLAALRFALGGLEQLGRAATGISRLYPQLARHVDFIRDARKSEGLPVPLPPGSALVVRLPNLRTESAPDAPLELRPGERLALLAAPLPDRALLRALATAIGDTQPIGPLALVRSWPEVETSSLRTAFGLGPALTAEELGSLGSEAGLAASEAALLQDCLDQPPPAAWPTLLVPTTLLWLHLLAAIERQAAIILVDGPGFTGLGEAAKRNLERRLQDCILVTRWRRAAAVGSAGERAMLLLEGERPKGWLPLPLTTTERAMLETVPTAATATAEMVDDLETIDSE
jgi:hypothetical protein